MIDWFLTKDFFEQIYWSLAFISSLFFIIIVVTTFVGGDADTDFDDVDLDTEIGFQFFTFKNMVGFFTIFSWSGLGFMKNGMSQGMVVISSMVCGAIMMTIMATLFYMMNRLVEDGTMKIKNAIGKTCEVYLPIKANNGGFGKVQIKIQGSTHELQAMTMDDIDLNQGMIVKVEEILDGHILLVTHKLK